MMNVKELWFLDTDQFVYFEVTSVLNGIEGVYSSNPITFEALKGFQTPIFVALDMKFAIFAI